MDEHDRPAIALGFFGITLVAAGLVIGDEAPISDPKAVQLVASAVWILAATTLYFLFNYFVELVDWSGVWEEVRSR